METEKEAEDVNSMEIRQRKEKKELQAQIQALKKVAKNDKTKKKDLAAEISRLESELEIRHNKEIMEAKLSSEHNLEPMVDETRVIKTKVSKAQRRRDKKSEQEKIREEEIKLQDKENVHGARNIEIQTITKRLEEKNLKIFTVPSDGDCLYKAVSHQLQLVKQETVSVDELREKVSNYIRDNKDDFKPFMCNPETLETLTDEEFEDYCHKIMNTKDWGGQLELRALSNILKCPINVIQAVGPDCIEQGTEFEGPPLIITYHRHMYSLGEHYNSTNLISVSENTS
ncbi:deubiquitinase OTUD6B [Bombyx mori]|uniref:ubiquitinyl hydrolase 1 n=1 Tax=Bombyx mori TaxID=7091 RepID=A0A8R2AWA1_BOMMO|nr:deubiquitinase OTUD6B [Bombyx mori]